MTGGDEMPRQMPTGPRGVFYNPLAPHEATRATVRCNAPDQVFLTLAQFLKGVPDPMCGMVIELVESQAVDLCEALMNAVKESQRRRQNSIEQPACDLPVRQRLGNIKGWS